MKLSRVVVSGANGFIGSHLVERLKILLGPDRVFGLVRRSNLVSRHTAYCDFSDPRRIVQVLRRLRPSILFHAAGGSNGTSKEMIEGNIFTTLHLFEALSAIRFPIRVVILGSAAEYGDTRQRCSASRTLLKPISPYAWAKACQTLLAGMAERSGLDVLTARLFNFTGPGIPSRFAVGAFAQRIVQAQQRGSRMIKVGNLGTYRDLLDIRDAMDAIIQVAKRGKRAEIYDVCSGVTTSMSQVLKILIRSSGKAFRIQDDSMKKRQEIPFSLGDPRAIRRLGWNRHFSLQQSLSDTLDFYRSELSANK